MPSFQQHAADLYQRCRPSRKECMETSMPARMQQVARERRIAITSELWQAVQSIGVFDRQQDHTEAEVVVTTPQGRPGSMRGTEHVIRDLFRDAKRKIIVMGYSMTEYSNIHALALEAYDRGVHVKLIGDRGQASSLMQKIREERSGGDHPELFLSTGEENSWLMHCKAMGVDDRHALIGSANFTRNGLALNAEIGVHLDDPEAAKNVEHLADHLIDRGLVKEVGQSESC